MSISTVRACVQEHVPVAGRLRPPPAVLFSLAHLRARGHSVSADLLLRASPLGEREYPGY